MTDHQDGTTLTGDAIGKVREFFEDYVEETEILEAAIPGTEDKALLLKHPQGITVSSAKKILDEFRTRPERREGTATVESLESFIGLTRRHADIDSALFGLTDNGNGGSTLLAVIDYHKQGTPEIGTPRFCRHLVKYPCPLSDAWKAWVEQNGKAMDQAAFAAFLENRILDLASPDDFPDHEYGELFRRFGASPAEPAAVVELSRGIELHATEQIKNSVRLAGGQVAMQYMTEHKEPSGAPVTVPSLFGIRVPVYRFGAPVSVVVRLRYRLQEGAVRWFYELYRATETRQAAFEDLCRQAADDTVLPIYFGSPEARAAA